MSAYDTKLIDAVCGLLSTFLTNTRLYNEQREMAFGVLESLSNAIDAKDPYTRGHAQRVSFLSENIALALGFDTAHAERLRIAGLLHDVGKIRGRSYLLESIVAPSRSIHPDYRQNVIETRDGRILIGRLLEESTKGVAIEINHNDKRFERIDLTPDQIASRRATKSAMPEDIIKRLSRTEIRDLVTYLTTLTGAKKTEAGPDGHGAARRPERSAMEDGRPRVFMRLGALAAADPTTQETPGSPRPRSLFPSCEMPPCRSSKPARTTAWDRRPGCCAESQRAAANTKRRLRHWRPSAARRLTTSPSSTNPSRSRAVATSPTRTGAAAGPHATPSKQTKVDEERHQLATWHMSGLNACYHTWSLSHSR